jgi:hypothetical protein
MGQLGESREDRMERLRVVCFHVRSSECGIPRLCQLRMDRLALVSKIDYVLPHIRFMGTHKLSSFDSRRVGRYLTLFHGCTLG